MTKAKKPGFLTWKHVEALRAAQRYRQYLLHVSAVL